MGYGTQRLITKPSSHSFYLFTSIFCFCCLVTSVNGQYVWKKGSWSECQLFGCGEGGTQVRPVWCERITETSSSVTQDGNCQHLQKPDEQRTCFKVCSEHRYQVKWATTSWSDCSLSSMATVCARGSGIRSRNVTCVWKGNGQLEEDSVCSSFEQKPMSRQHCELRCPQDCVVGVFSEWNSCESCRYANKTRTRNIIVPPSNGGKECLQFTESVPCRNCTTAYFLSIFPWSKCVPFTSTTSHPQVGHQNRDIKCINGLGARVNYRYCREGIHLTESIIYHQPCLIPQDCDVNEWSSWKLINSSCMDINGRTIVGKMKRYRSVLQVPRGSGKPCPPLEETTEVQGTDSRKCPRTYWKVSEWSSCQPVHGMQQCSTGLQHRQSICIEESQDGRSKPVADERCTEERPLTSQTCRADCHWDCTVSLWSQWTECRVTDCEQYARKRRTNQKTGQRYRTREVLTLPGMGGQQCPHLSETQNCDPKPCYNWNITTGKCILRKTNGGQPCGVGIAHRTFACVNKFGMRVADSLCNELHGQPDGTVSCQVACPNDCVLSDWGEWTECPDLCQEGQILHSNIKSRRRTVLARQGPAGNRCPASPIRDMTEVMDCPTVIECATYMWQADPWNPCLLSNTKSKCGRGTQTREVACYNSKKQLVSDEKCTTKVKPTGSQNCNVPCPKDCIVTEFSDWTPCSATCWEGKDTVPTKMRQRYILQYPDNGGASCPELLKEVQQCQDLPFCRGFQWDTTEWSDCILPPDVKKCGLGLKARDVLCKSDNGTTHSIDTCLRYVGTMPKMSESCTVSCVADCTFTNWQSWSMCVGGCDGKRFRSRTLVNEDTAPSDCRNIAKHPQYEQEPCLCGELSPVVLGDWSECILEPLERGVMLPKHISRHAMRQTRNASNFDSTCGSGYRYKVIACKNEQNNIETALNCEVAEYREEVCMIPCPVDCVMSDWSEWTKCPSECGAGVQQRFRHIQRLPSSGGRRCPSLDGTSKDIQSRLCHPECTDYLWNTYDWSMCIPKDGAPCGEGNQTRHVRCHMVNSNGHTTGTASNHFCSRQDRPPNTRTCYMPCLGECVVSEWTVWTMCQQPCNLNQQQQRTRKVMREATSQAVGSLDCPRLTEMKMCIRGDNCMEYSWELSSWTSCLVNNGLDNCGVGHKERYAICKNHFGVIVNKRHCDKVLGPVTEPLVFSCEVPCDVDCLLSDWSPWSTCSRTCGLGQNKRDRFIVQQFLGNGRPCPASLTQTKPCFNQGCYSWNVSDWSPCATQRGLCGHGTQTRAISCLGEDMLPAPTFKCPPDLNVLVMQTERQCHVPCPGECIITDWTPWNTCFITCEDFHTGYRRGVQSRSRSILAHANTNNEPCPTRLWESQSCDSDFCMSFSWRAEPWQKSNHRSVWCERSDGLRVEGGCKEGEKPPTVLLCTPPCANIPQSYCNDTDTCICHDNYNAVYDTVGALMACTEENSTVTKEAQESVANKGGEQNIWMYAVVATATIFCIFVALALYNMSELFRTGPRPRGREDDEEEEDQLDPRFTSSTPNQSHLDGLTALDNCNVCKQMPAPPGDAVTSPDRHSTMETICNETVGACMKVLVCASSSKHEMHDETECSFAAEHVAMETYACVHRPLEYSMPVEKSATITSAPTSRPGPISTNVALKHSQSDSAISIPTGSVGSTCKNSKKSISMSSNYSSPYESKKIKKINGNHDNSLARESVSSKFSRTPDNSRQNSEVNESTSSERGSVCLDDVEAGNYIQSVVGNGSLEFFVQDYFQKIESLPKPQDYDTFDETYKCSNSGQMSDEKINLLSSSNENDFSVGKFGPDLTTEFSPDLKNVDNIEMKNFNNPSEKFSSNVHPEPFFVSSPHLHTRNDDSLVNAKSHDGLIRKEKSSPDMFSNGDAYRQNHRNNDYVKNVLPKELVFDENSSDSVGSCSDLTLGIQTIGNESSSTENGTKYNPDSRQNSRTRPSLNRQKNFDNDDEILEPLLPESDKGTRLSIACLSGMPVTNQENNFHSNNRHPVDFDKKLTLQNDNDLKKESLV